MFDYLVNSMGDFILYYIYVNFFWEIVICLTDVVFIKFINSLTKHTEIRELNWNIIYVLLKSSEDW